jgi:hypothetical protein
MDYKTIRSLEGIEKSNHNGLVKLLNRKSFAMYFNSRKGKNIIILENPKISKDNEIIKGIFRGGTFKEIEIYNKEGGLDANIWFEGGNYATGLKEVYDIMFPETIKGESIELKIFNFFAGAADETEHSSVIHSDPFLAYKFLKDQDKIISAKQELFSVEPIKVGKVFYEHKTFA